MIVRLIDADALIERIDKSQAEGFINKNSQTHILVALSQVFEIIKKQPTIEPEPHWIPCSERLPSDEDYDETFTVTIQCEHVQDWDDYVTGYADWTPHGWDIQSYYIGQIKVIAWMSLPEPYKGE